MNRFEKKLASRRMTLKRTRLHTLQINVGRQCNQACRHCHVDAAPWRTEMLDAPTAERIGGWIARNQPATVDITGGAPELCTSFRYLVETSRKTGCHVIDRCNLTIIEETGFDWLPRFLAENEVEIIASLPCHQPGNVERQRGHGVFEKSIRALRKLNDLGYGHALSLNLVYNPVGITLPPSQQELEADYKEALWREHGIVFNQLYTITNQPIARFADDLRAQGRWDEYMELLMDNFNAAAVDGLMCRDSLSVGYRGELYDCDFNQMLGLQLSNGSLLHLWDISPEYLDNRKIMTGEHCLACTAGHGSSCNGALT
jgi:radical SAM/Cys-rich protein